MKDRIEALVEYLEAQEDIALAILFGSFGTADQRADSDVDIALLWQPVRGHAEPMPIDRQMAIVDALADRTGCAVDLVDLASAGIPILGTVLTTGRTLMARDPDLRACEKIVRLLRPPINGYDCVVYGEICGHLPRQAPWISPQTPCLAG